MAFLYTFCGRCQSGMQNVGYMSDDINSVIFSERVTLPDRRYIYSFIIHIILYDSKS